jgi:uncharacterized membrane-anchored protein
MKVRESYNYTDPSNNYVVSVETMEDTNIPQLESAMAFQGSYSSISATTVTLTAQPPGYGLETAVLIVVAIVAVTAVMSNYVRLRQRGSLNPVG